MHTNCYFGASDQNSEIAIRFINPDFFKKSRVLRDTWAELYQMWEKRRVIICAQGFVLDFRYLATFRNAGGVKTSGVES